MRRKTIQSLVLLFLSAGFVCAQTVPPAWTQNAYRERDYPSQEWYTGFVSDRLQADANAANSLRALELDAQNKLAESIIVTIEGKTRVENTSRQTGSTETTNTDYRQVVQTATTATTVRTEVKSYHDQSVGMLYAFAAARRADMAAYYRSQININITQAEGLLQTAQDLETSGEKAKARQQCETAKPLLEKVRSAQDLLTAIDANITAADLQQTKTEALHNRLTQALARLAQAVLVYMESAESNFSKPSTVLTNRLKSTLSAKGCSFTDDPMQADFRMQISATTRHYGDEHGFTVCYADVAINLFDTHKNKSVFQDEFSQKGILKSQETAGRKALEDAAPVVANKISQWIE